MKWVGLIAAAMWLFLALGCSEDAADPDSAARDMLGDGRRLDAASRPDVPSKPEQSIDLDNVEDKGNADVSRKVDLGLDINSGQDMKPDNQVKPDVGVTPDLVSTADSGVPISSWAIPAGGTGEDVGLKAVLDSAGNLYVTGTFQGSATFGSFTLAGSAGTSGFIAKVSTAGKVVWAKATGTLVGYGADVDASGNVFVGGSAGVSKIGASGTVAWTNSTVGVRDLDLDTKGNIYISPWSLGKSPAVSKMDSTGKVLWSAPAPSGTGTVAYRAIGVDGSGNSYVAGGFSSDVTFGSTSLKNVNSTWYDIFVAKVTAAGKYAWARSAGTGVHDYARAVAVDKAGNCYVTGYFNSVSSTTIQPIKFGSFALKTKGFVDFFVTKLDTNGKFLWANSGGSASSNSSDAAYGIALDSTGNSYITGSIGPSTLGSTTLSNQGYSDVFVAKLNSNGGFVWALSAGGKHGDSGGGVAVDAANNILTAGFFGADPGTLSSGGTAAFGTQTLTSFGKQDVFAWKIKVK